MALRAVQKTDEFKGAISDATNYTLEAELLGIPLWLNQEMHQDEAMAVMRLIAAEPREIFVRHAHRLLWDAFRALVGKNSPPSEGWLQQVLTPAGGWTDDQADRAAVSAALLDELAEKGALPLTVETGDSPARFVREDLLPALHRLYRQRQVIHATEALYERVTSWNGRTDTEIDEAIDDIRRAFDRRPVREQTDSLLSSLMNSDVQAIAAQDGREPTDRIMTGFASVDRITGGLMPGNLVILAGRTSMGKTALALDIALRAAQDGFAVLYCSYEMTRIELTRRIAAKTARINVLRLRHGALEPWQLEQYQAVARDARELPIVIDEGNHTPAGIEAKIREYGREQFPLRFNLVIVDHLQLMGCHDSTRYERRDRQLATYTAQLKDLAKRLNLTVLALSQVNRESAREQRPPRLSDLRDSGGLEQDSDAVLGIHRPSVDKPEAAPNEATLCVLKNRHGPCGHVPLTWNGELAMFHDPTQDGDENAVLDHI